MALSCHEISGHHRAPMHQALSLGPGERLPENEFYHGRVIFEEACLHTQQRRGRGIAAPDSPGQKKPGRAGQERVWLFFDNQITRIFLDYCQVILN
jgi:hypothetical protein